MQECLRTFYNNRKTIADSITSTMDFFKDLNMVELKIKAVFASWSFLSHSRSFYGYFLLKSEVSASISSLSSEKCEIE